MSSRLLAIGTSDSSGMNPGGEISGLIVPPGTGLIYVYNRPNEFDQKTTSWNLVALLSGELLPNERFGTSVVINDPIGGNSSYANTQIIAGAPGTGRVYVFALENPLQLNSWRKIQTIVDPTLTQFSILSNYRLGE